LPPIGSNAKLLRVLEANRVGVVDHIRLHIFGLLFFRTLHQFCLAWLWFTNLVSDVVVKNIRLDDEVGVVQDIDGGVGDRHKNLSLK
jgi:hypothetical protein